MNKTYTLILVFLIFATATKINAQKPSIWVHTDGTAITGFNNNEALTDQNSDPDDQVALAMYLMNAHKVNTKAIVMGITNRNTTKDPVASFNNYHRAAYAKDYTCLSKLYEGFPHPDSLKVYESSTTVGSSKILFDNSPDNKYDDYNSLLPTVKLLVDELQKDEYTYENPLYVAVWGGMTEAAMAIKHLLRNNDTAALKRCYVVSHWHTSYTNTQSKNNCYSGNDAEKYGCANCNVNCESCKYVRDEAKKTGAYFRWVDCASVGQTGIVNGSNGYFSGGVGGSVYNRFAKSGLGELFVKCKFAYGKPDGSDIATLYAILGNYGVTLNTYNTNGQTTASQETTAKNAFINKTHNLLNELLEISDAASGDCSSSIEAKYNNEIMNVYPNPSFGNLHITVKNGMDGVLHIFDITGRAVWQKTINAKENGMEANGLKPGIYLVRFNGKGIITNQRIVVQ